MWQFLVTRVYSSEPGTQKGHPAFCYGNGNGYGSSLLPLPLKYSVVNLLAHAVTIPQLHSETFGVRDLVPLEGRLEVGNARVS